MKITWFSNTAFRIHIGGQILVVDADQAPKEVEPKELLSGADLVVRLAEEHPQAEGPTWSPRPPERLLDAGESGRPLAVWGIGTGSLLIDADADHPLLLLAGEVPNLGRWMEQGVVILADGDLAARASRLLEERTPRLIALAGDEVEVSAAFDAVRDRLDGAGLIALEPGMAVEV